MNAAQVTTEEALQFGSRAYFNKRYDEALCWYLKADALGGSNDPSPAGLIGILYGSGGFGVPKDDVKAFTWYLKGARQGDTFAMYRVADALQDGIGVNKDPAMAKRWKDAANAESDAQSERREAAKRERERARDDERRMSRCLALRDEGVNYTHPEWGWYRPNCRR